MSSFLSNIHAPQLVSGHPFGGAHNNNNYGIPALAPYYTKPPRFALPETAFPLPAPTAQHLIPRDVLEKRSQTPCKHFEHHLGWCPYGKGCHFLHDYSRLSSRGTSATPSLASNSSASSSLRSSPVPSGLWYPPPLNSFQAGPVFGAPPPTYRVPPVPRHGFVPRTIGGTTYFPIRLDPSRLGYVTLRGVEVFTDH
ncbi:hypothetical protein BC827DRAFT_969254 [Russula dissimulans]|nr:hypothetical protein BC827DRAFT_969254 [Russula dissimulans]